MADSALREKGREMRRKLLGDATVERMDKAIYNDPIMAKFAEVTQETHLRCAVDAPGPRPENPSADLRDFRRHQRPRS